MSFSRLRQRQRRIYVACVADTAPPPKAKLRFDVIDARATELGLTKGQLAQQVGLDPSTIWRYRRGELHPTFPVLIRFRKVLDLSIDDMIGNGTGQPENGGTQ